MGVSALFNSDPNIADFLDATSQFAAILTTPKSSGRIRLNSADPTEAPNVTVGYLTHPEDLARQMENLKTLKKFVDSAGLTNYRIPPMVLATLIESYAPQCNIPISAKFH